MFKKTLPRKTKNILALLAKSHLLKDAYLAGGTACALYLGHRVSYDLDFFTQRKFNPLSLVNKLSKVKGFKLEKTAWGTILGEFDKIRFSLFYYSYSKLYSFKNFHGIKIADLRDIAAMKITSIAERGTKRDFIDLYFICQKIPLSKILSLYDKKYGKLTSNLLHILKSLTYFEDAEKDPLPKMLKSINWKEVKEFFKKEIKKIKI